METQTFPFCTMSLSPLSEIDRLCTLIDKSTGDREGSAWRKNLWAGRVRACMSKSMSQSVAIDPAGFIPSKVNTARPSEEETVSPLPREHWDESDSVLYSSFMLKSVTTAERPKRWTQCSQISQRTKAVCGKGQRGKLRVSVANSLRISLEKKVQKTKTRRARRIRTHREAALSYCCWTHLWCCLLWLRSWKAPERKEKKNHNKHTANYIFISGNINIQFFDFQYMLRRHLPNFMPT